MTRIAVVSPEFPVPDEPHRGQPIYMTILGLTSCPGIELEVFCPTATYPAWLNHRFNRAWIQALKDHSPPGVGTHYFGYPALPASSRPTNGYMSAYTLLPRLRAFRPDLILAYWLYPEGFGAVTAGKYLGVPVVVGARGTDLRWIQDRVSRYFVRKTLRQADAVLTVSTASAWRRVLRTKYRLTLSWIQRRSVPRAPTTTGTPRYFPAVTAPTP